jgi:hypothetical protein
MTTWAKRSFAIDGGNAEHTFFENHFDALGRPVDMMMVEVTSPDHTSKTFYVALPDASLLPLYKGFVQIQPDQLPKTAVPLCGYDHRFKELFPGE